ncbi:rhodanese-like domain-containing protein, partial [Eudoraea sp.]|uniref:rhodanese-like domain-containing protein n=1 Tax=Eudoraea sp. TaxID=1979955 RepID=UPI003C787C35
TTYLLIDEKGKEHGIITGDTLFIGDVGRPDLAQHVVSELTEEKLAAHLYDSLRNKIMPLGDELIIYPNHGAGSACGKMMSKETTDTLGHQKKVNYALRADMTKEEFIKELLTGLTAPPGYFPQNVLMNIKGYESLDDVIERGERPLSSEAFELEADKNDALILDTRNAKDFAKGHIPNSINIGLDGSFAQWVGEIVPDVNQKILLVTYPGKEEEAITRLSRVGYDKTIGFLEGGFDRWIKDRRTVERIKRITVDQFQKAYFGEGPLVFDVRKKSEFDSEHIEGAINIPLNELEDNLWQFPKDKPFVIHCAGGYRSMIAASILMNNGWEDFVDVIEGFDGMKNTNIPRSEYICPTTML